MTDRLNRLAVSICGAGHSGSTLLGLVLGTSPEVFYAGEAKKTLFLGDEDKPLRKRVCKICGEPCEVWSRFEGPEPDLYEALSRLTGCPVIVDSTKRVDWIRERGAEVLAAGAEHRLVFLTRDGRAVVNSRARKYRRRDPAAIVDSWRAQIEATEALVREAGERAIRVRYEELATAPERTIAAVCAALGLGYDPAMLRYEATPQHPLGGNTGTQSVVARAHGVDSGFAAVPERSKGYYGGLGGGFRLDLRWRTELDPELRRVFEERAGELNEPYRWEASA